MQYEKFKNIFNETIFEESKAVLIEKIAKYPNRYIGLFRPTKPKAKILQNFYCNLTKSVLATLLRKQLRNILRSLAIKF